MTLLFAKPKDIEGFRHRVRDEGIPLLQRQLTDEWFEEVIRDCQEVHSGRKKEFKGSYFPIRWLLEDGDWEFINVGLKLIDKITARKKLLKNLVRGVKLDDWMLSSTNALGLSVICRLAHDGILTDIEPKVSQGSDRRADALVNISDQEILVEATRVTKDLVSENATIGAVDVDKMVFQTISKMIAKSEQLEGTEQPSIVITTCAPRIGADPINAEWAVKDNIGAYPNLSAVVVASTHRFRYGECYSNENAQYPLCDQAKMHFSKLLKLPPVLERLRAQKN